MTFLSLAYLLITEPFQIELGEPNKCKYVLRNEIHSESWPMCSARDQPKVWYYRSFDLTANEVVFQVLSLLKSLTTSLLFKFYPGRKIKLLNFAFVCVFSQHLWECAGEAFQ